jgi:chromosome partitioning protein
MGYIVTLSNNKGGVGKTTSAVNIAAAIANKGKKVLVIDLDGQANLSQSFGAVHHSPTIVDIFNDESDFKPFSINGNLDVLPTNSDLSAIETAMNPADGDQLILKNILSNVKEKYDFILIDCPPSLGMLTINALVASDFVLIPLQAEFLPAQGLSKLVEAIESIKKNLNKSIQLLGVFFTMYNTRRILSKDVKDTVESYMGDSILKNFIRENVALAEAPTQALDIFRYNKDSNGAKDYQKLTDEILQRLSVLSSN